MGEKSDHSENESRFKKFSDDTSFHGIKELYYSKSVLSWTLWGFVIFTAFTLTGFQVVRAIVQYVCQPSSTVVLPTNIEEILYPKIRTCYMHWSYWVDWKKAYSLNYTKPAILYALSFMSVIYSSENFSILEARNNLTTQMESNNVTCLSEFYKSIAKKFPLANVSNLGPIDDSQFFTEIELVHKKFWGNVLCYSTRKEVFEKYMSSLTNTAEDNVFGFTVQDQSYSLFSDYVTKEEYSRTIAWWMYYRANYVFTLEASLSDLSNITLPLLFYIDAFSHSSDQIMYSVDWYKIEVYISARRWKNTPSHRCKTGTKGILKNQTDIELCQASYQLTTCLCPYFSYLSLLFQDTHSALCSKAINFLNDSTTPFLSHAKSDYESSSLKCRPNDDADDDRDRCLNQIQVPCEIWTYNTMTSFYTFDIAMQSIAKKNVTEVYVVFPIADEILITIETDTQTFEDFVGNVGGVLGIWTGASVLSFIQLFYFCCCWQKKRNSSTTNIVGTIDTKKNNLDSVSKSVVESEQTKEYFLSTLV